ncbi:MAG TPA: hypothetical protein VK675_01195 [Candidatus Paceibacterota bacterium]|nr:hypothetical protein [Candidatus Paceibacterota bacterium]
MIKIIKNAFSAIRRRGGKKNGYAVLELLFYIAFFAIFSIISIDSMIVMAKSFKETAILTEFAQSGAIMERMSRETRQAYGIDFTSTTSDLKLNTKDSSGVNKTIEFKFISPNIQLWDSGSNIGNLNPPNIVVTALSFTQITTGSGKAVKISLTIRSNRDSSNRLQDFNDTVVLRGSY